MQKVSFSISIDKVVEFNMLLFVHNKIFFTENCFKDIVSQNEHWAIIEIQGLTNASAAALIKAVNIYQLNCPY